MLVVIVQCTIITVGSQLDIGFLSILLFMCIALLAHYISELQGLLDIRLSK